MKKKRGWKSNKYSCLRKIKAASTLIILALACFMVIDHLSFNNGITGFVIYDFSGGDNLNIMAVPTQDTPILNATDFPDNTTSANLTAYNQSTTDADGDIVKNIYDWRLNGTSIAILNLPFENNTNNVSNSTKDYSSNSLNGSVVDAFWNSSGGYDGKGAYHFDGNQHIYVSGISLNSFSVSLWAKRDKLANSVIASRGTTSTSSYFYIIAGADGVTRFQMRSSEYLNNKLWSANCLTSSWTHIAVTYDETDDSSALYCNGVKAGTLNDNIYYTIKPGSNINIGDRPSLDTGFNGSIDDFVLWNRTLSPEQVLALYTNRTDLIVSNETQVHDTWQACITPNDGYSDGTEKCSNNVTINENKPPAVSIINPTDGTNFSSGLQVFNVSVTSKAGISTVLFMFTTNTTPFNVTASNDGDNWNASVNLSTLVEGTHTITVFANDSSNQINQSENISFTIDRTNPTVTVSCSPSPVTIGESLSCSCSGSDVGSGVKNTSFSGTSPSTSTSGTFSTSSCLVFDYSGNSNTASGSYTVDAATSSGGGGAPGSSGGVTFGVEGQFKKEVWNSIYGDETASIIIKDIAIGITSVDFTAKEEILGPWIEVKKLDSSEKEADDFGGRIFQSIKITVGRTLDEGKISDARISFMVDKSFLDENGIDKNDVALYRYVDGEWNRLPTTISGENTDYVHYLAETPGFSYFIIGQKEGKKIETVELNKTREEVIVKNSDGDKTISTWIKLVLCLAIILISFAAIYLIPKIKIKKVK